jgi:hypothetical protein
MDNSAILGTWNWTYSTEGNTIVASASSGVKKSLVFTKGGILFVSHNDSTGIYDYLEVYPQVKLYSNPVMDTDTYQFSKQGDICSFEKFNALSTNGRGILDIYQYALSEDSFKIYPAPCLAPIISTFARQ